MRHLAFASVALAVLLGAAWWLFASDTEAKPAAILALNPDIVNELTAAICTPGCDLTDPADLLNVADADGDGDGQVEVEDFASLDVDGNQLLAVGGTLWVLVFVDDDDPVTIDPRAHLRFPDDLNGDGDLTCDEGIVDGFADEDCDDDGIAGDGVVVGTLLNRDAEPGDVEQVEAEQEGLFVAIDIYVVSELVPPTPGPTPTLVPVGPRILALNPDIVNELTAAACAPGCDLTGPADLLDVADADGDGDGRVEVDDFASLDVDGNQLLAVGGTLWVLVFVDDDDPVTVDPRAHLRFPDDLNGDGDLTCDEGIVDGFADEDCDDDGIAGDGVVVGTLLNRDAEPGDVEQVEAEQEGLFVAIDIYVVSELATPTPGPTPTLVPVGPRILALNPDIVNELTAATCTPGCDLTDPADLLAVADADGDGDGRVEVDDFASLDVDGNQLLAEGGTLWVLVFVDDDDPVTIDPRAHLRFLEDTGWDGDFNCDDGTGDDAYAEEDCDADGIAGDGVVVGTLVNDFADPGDLIEIEAEQGLLFTSLDIWVVGLPDDIWLTAAEDDIHEALPGAAPCADLGLYDGFEELVDKVDVTGLRAFAEDSDGIPLAGVLVDWASSDTDVIDLSKGTTITLVQDEETFAVNLACGDAPGSADATASFDYTPGGDAEDDSVTIKVWGGPLPTPPPQQAWVARYDGPASGPDGGSFMGLPGGLALALDGSGSVYVTGSSEGSTTGQDYATIKYASDGSERWVARYDGPASGLDQVQALAMDGSGNVYVTGYSTAASPWDYGYATIKYGPDGSEQWVARYGGPVGGSGGGFALAVDGTGNAYVTGWSQGTPGFPLDWSTYDYATIKYGPDGSEQWVARYDGPSSGEDRARALAVDGSGNVYVTGGSDGSGTGNEYATVKYGPDGAEQWVARYDGPASGYERASALDVDGSGNVYVTGSSEGSSTGRDYATIKYAPDGSEEWVARYDGPASGYDYAQALALDGSGNVYVTGYSWDPSTGYDYATIKYGPDGSEEWVARYDRPASGHDKASALDVDGSGNVYVTGSCYGPGTGDDYATIKYGPDGREQWVGLYDGPGHRDDRADDLVVDASGNVYVTGSSYGGFRTGSDYATIKYAPALIPTPTSTPVAPRPPGGGGPVGGTFDVWVDCPDPQTEPLADSSGGNMNVLAGIAAAVAVGAVTLASAAWYLRRRRLE